MAHSITTDCPDSLDIEWVVNNYCNYQCSYCNPDLYGNTSRALDTETAAKFFQTLHEKYPDKKMLTLSGGEPTLWKHLPEFIDSVAQHYYFHIVTNGSRTLNWWKNFMHGRSIDRITISTHAEFYNAEHLLNNIQYLSNLTDVTVLVLLKPGHLAEHQNFIDSITTRNINVCIKPKAITSHDTRSIVQYSKEETLYIQNFRYNNSNRRALPGIAQQVIVDGEAQNQDSLMQLIAKQENNFQGWYCDLGRSRLFIWHDGNVFAATCKTAMSRPIGNVYENAIEDYHSTSICKDAWCHCIPDMRIPKRKP